MRPLRLSLQAFGSYPDELCIDFARLGRHGIFAIAGPTGAGKSTIFDAMVYALYDDLPGFRVDGNIRSQYAEAGTLTTVCLEFEVHGEQWRIERCPTQPVPRRRGSGETTEKASTVRLCRVGADGGGLSRKHEVAAKVEELLGLTKEQFEQVVLIPQGRFEEVLKADTKQRASLLRRLFPVDVFARVTDALRAMATERERAYLDAGDDHAGMVDQVRQILDRVANHLPDDLVRPVADGLAEPLAPGAAHGFDEGALSAEGFEPARLPEHLALLGTCRAALAHVARDAQAAADRASQALADAIEGAKRWESCQRDLAEAVQFSVEETADAAEAVLLDRAATLRALGGALDAWAAAGTQLEQIDAERVQAVKAVDALWVDGYDRDRLAGGAGALALAGTIDADARALRSAAEELDRLVTDEAALGAAQRALAAVVEDLRDRRVALEALESTVHDEEARIAELEPVATERAGLDATARALSEELGRGLRRVEAEREADRRAVALAAATEVATTMAAEAEAVRGAWRQGLAGRLAQGLVAGSPCPTCGGVEHPSPAALLADAPSDEVLERAEDAARQAAKQVLRLTEAASQARGASEALALARPVAEVEAELTTCRAELAAAESAGDALTELATSITEHRRRLEDDRADLEALARRVAVEEATAADRGSRLAAARAAFLAAHGDVSPAPAAAARESLAVAVRQLASVVDAAEQVAASQRTLLATLAPTVEAFGVDAPTELSCWRLSDVELAGRQRRLAEREDHRREVRTRIASYEATGGPAERPDPEPLRDAAARAAAHRDDLVGRRAVVEEGATALEAAPQRLAAAAGAIEAAREAFGEAKAMADLCAGAGGGPVGSRLSLENWVLADYLRQVVAQGNERLSAMTGGRFSLQLGAGQTDGRKQWGLELDAFDVNTGRARPVRTLSGGETFMAALSLALGLADVVSGGSNREMGALFVDEGFGSLDPQSLEAVMDVLRSLEDGGRIVGVISHVEDVQRSLVRGVTVESTPAGSVAQVHYPPD